MDGGDSASAAVRLGISWRRLASRAPILEEITMSAPAVALGIPSRTLGSLGLPAVRGQEDRYKNWVEHCR